MITPELIITNSYLAEINFAQAGAAGQRVYFKDIPTLTPRDGVTTIQTVGLEVISQDELAVSPNGNTVILSANLSSITLTLTVQSKEVVFQIPCNSLRTTNNGGLIRRFYNLPINIVKSYVTVTTAGIAAGESVLFNFYYREVKK